ncbi:MAG: hypothetical protein H6Q15_2080 [Bacteroidetes bacterium]|nr:hypothetical protein [Bacteroidota bacterium]
MNATEQEQDVQVTYYSYSREIVYKKNGVVTCSLTGDIAREIAEKLVMKNKNIDMVNDTINVKNKLIRQFHAVLAKKGVLEFKADILAGYDVEHASDLSISQLEEVIAKHNNMAPPKQIREARSKCLNLIGKIGINPNDGWGKVNEFCVRPQICGKVLYECSLSELQTLERKIRAIISKSERRTK